MAAVSKTSAATILCETGKHLGCLKKVESSDGTPQPCACPCHKLEPVHLIEAIAAWGGSILLCSLHNF